MRETDIDGRLGGIGTSTVSDALDRLGLGGAVTGILPLDEQFKVSGQAFTVAYQAVDERSGTVGDFVDDLEPGTVVLIDNRGRLDCTVWGDIMTSLAHHRGLGGTVINGVCRDVARSLELGYPVFSRGRHMQTGKDRVRLAAVQVPVHLGQVLVEPGDHVVGDADGVVVIAERNVRRVLEVALSIEAAEDQIRSAVLAGERLEDARKKHGYHSLQTRAEVPSS